MSGSCTRNLGHLHPGSPRDGEACGAKTSSAQPVMVVTDGRGRRRIVGPMCDGCWSELLVHGYGPSVAGDSFTPDGVLERLARSGTAELLPALAARGQSRLPVAVIDLLVAGGIEVPATGECVDLIEARAFATTVATSPGRARRMVSVAGVAGLAAVVAGAVGLGVVQMTRSEPSGDVDAAGTTSPAVVLDSVSSTSTSSPTTVVAPTTEVSAVSTSVRTAPQPSASTPSPTTVASRPPSGWVTAGTESCVSAQGVQVTIRWTLGTGSVTATRLLLNGTEVAASGSTVEWVGDGAAATGTWMVQVQPTGAWSGNLSMAGCA